MTCQQLSDANFGPFYVEDRFGERESLEMVQGQLMCADIDLSSLVHRYGIDTIAKLFYTMKKEDYIDNLGTEGFDIIYEMRFKEAHDIHQYIEDYPERFI